MEKALAAHKPGARDLPEHERPSAGHIGEYPWHPVYRDVEPWISADASYGLPVRTMPTALSYLAERAGHDYSIEDTFTVRVPGPGLVAGMPLSLADGRDNSYVDAEGDLAFFDPSVQEKGCGAALVARAAFHAFLDREGLEAVWVIEGEKRAYGGPAYGRGFGGSHAFVSTFWRSGEGFQRSDATFFEPAAADQLEEFMSDDPEAGISTPAKRPSRRRSARRNA